MLSTFRLATPETRPLPRRRGSPCGVPCAPMPSQSTRRAAFTLVELLVVIAILGLLAALLFPVLAQTREAGRATRCAANLKQIGMALHLYAEDHDEHFLPFGFLSGEPSPGN